MGKLTYWLATLLLVPIALVTAALALWWFTTDGNTSVNFWNHSHTGLGGVVVSVGEHAEKLGYLAPGESAGFVVHPRLTLDVRVAFNAAGSHHYLPTRIRELPFGDSILSVSVDDQLRVTASSKPTFMFR